MALLLSPALLSPFLFSLPPLSLLHPPLPLSFPPPLSFSPSLPLSPPRGALLAGGDGGDADGCSGSRERSGPLQRLCHRHVARAATELATSTRLCILIFLQYNHAHIRRQYCACAVEGCCSCAVARPTHARMYYEYVFN